MWLLGWMQPCPTPAHSLTPSLLQGNGLATRVVYNRAWLGEGGRVLLHTALGYKRGPSLGGTSMTLHQLAPRGRETAGQHASELISPQGRIPATSRSLADHTVGQSGSLASGSEVMITSALYPLRCARLPPTVCPLVGSES